MTGWGGRGLVSIALAVGRWSHGLQAYTGGVCCVVKVLEGVMGDSRVDW